jgi:hypothetical protein
VSVVKRVLSLVFACLMAFTFPSIIIFGVLNSAQDSQEQESVIDFNKPVFEIVFPIEPICYRRVTEPESSVSDKEQEYNVVVSETEEENHIDEQNDIEEYNIPEENLYSEYYDDDEYVYEELEENSDEYDDYNPEEYDFDFVGEEQQSIIPSEQFQEDGVEFWNGYYWTYYSELALPGEDLDIPGRYTDYDGYVCDENNYICLASDSLPRGTVVSTPFGKDGKVYDCGCGNDYVLDVYCSW